jgi:hypothetical protein
LAFAILMARLWEVANLPLTLAAALVFGLSGIGNSWAYKKPFIGGILLILTGFFISMDWLVNR